MLSSCKDELKKLEQQISELKIKEQNERVKFSFIFDIYPDVEIKTWDLNISEVDQNKLVEIDYLYCGNIGSRYDRRKLRTFQCAFSMMATSDMNDFFLLKYNNFDYHNNLDYYHYYLIPFLKIENIFVFPDFCLIDFRESEWKNVKKDSSEIVNKLKEKNLNDSLIDKILEVGGFKEQKKKEDLNSLLDLYYSVSI